MADAQSRSLPYFSDVEVRRYLWGRRLFPFRKRSLPFLTVDAIIGNQTFCHGR